LIVVFDASMLIYLVDEHAKAPLDPKTGSPVAKCAERISALLEQLQSQGAKIVVPTPALAEVLVRAGTGADQRLRILGSSKHFRITPFDEVAAVEFAATQATRGLAGVRSSAPTHAKAKFDDQIVAIAGVSNATVIYSDDGDIKKLAAGRFTVTGIGEISLPPEEAQGVLALESSNPVERSAPDDQSW